MSAIVALDFDAAPVHVVTTASLAPLAVAQPDGRFDPRRFRPNVVLDTGGTGFVENDWVSTSLRVGADVAPRKHFIIQGAYEVDADAIDA